MEILDRQVKKLKKNEVFYVKVIWINQLIEEATWEAETSISLIILTCFLKILDKFEVSNPLKMELINNVDFCLIC